jgi:hypothetical protein
MVITNDGRNNPYLKFFVLWKYSICAQTRTEKSYRSQSVVHWVVWIIGNNAVCCCRFSMYKDSDLLFWFYITPVYWNVQKIQRDDVTQIYNTFSKWQINPYRVTRILGLGVQAETPWHKEVAQLVTAPPRRLKLLRRHHKKDLRTNTVELGNNVMKGTEYCVVINECCSNRGV